MNGIGSTPYTAEWSWMAVCASKDASLSLDNATMTLDGTGAGNAHAIYFCSNNKLNLANGSNLTIKNYQQDALEWNGGDGGYNVNITDSTFVSDHNRSGFTGTFYATITNSQVDVVNSSGNGSNGSHFIVTDSTVNFNDNGSHGLSTGILTIDNSTVNANRNGANGIHASGVLTVRNNAVVTVEDNGCSIISAWTIPGALYVGAGQSVIDGSTVTICNNRGSGIYQKAANGSLDVRDSNVVVMQNTAEKLGYGGGLYANGSVTFDENVVLYNNHANIAGDDLYAEEGASITFGEVGKDWRLDGEPDCTDAITGWFEDGIPAEGAEEGVRWEAHAGAGESNHVERLAVPDEGTVRVEGPVALKAAHSLKYAVDYVWVSAENPTDVTCPTSAETYEGETFEAEPQAPSEGWTFDGWYLDEACTEAFPADGVLVKGDMTLYGAWSKVAQPTPVDPADPAEPAEPVDPVGSDVAEPARPTELAQTGDSLPVTAAATAAAAAGAAALAAAAACARKRSER